jgi:hypothetical protein
MLTQQMDFVRSNQSRIKTGQQNKRMIRKEILLFFFGLKPKNGEKKSPLALTSGV